MTATIDHITTTAHDSAALSSSERLLAVLQDTVSACAQEDPDRLHSWLPAGSAMVALSRLAREATADLGSRPGTTLTDGPGVVVVRDLVSATQVLGSAVATASLAPHREVDAMVPFAKGLQAAFAVALTSRS